MNIDIWFRYTKDVVKVVGSPDRREPEYVLYDTPSSVLNIYTVKPAIFDLVRDEMKIFLYLLIYLGSLHRNWLLSCWLLHRSAVLQHDYHLSHKPS